MTVNNLKADIETIQDVQLLVDRFYEKVREDQTLGPIFDRVVGDKWPVHLDRMYRFWQTILLAEHTYHGSPFPPHMKLPIGKEHFDRWLSLFSETLKENFGGAKCDEALWRAGKMAEMFQYKLDHYRSHPNLNPQG